MSRTAPPHRLGEADPRACTLRCSATPAAACPGTALADLTPTSHALAEIADIAPDTHEAYVGASAVAQKARLCASAITVDPEPNTHITPWWSATGAGAGHRDGRPGHRRA